MYHSKIHLASQNYVKHTWVLKYMYMETMRKNPIFFPSFYEHTLKNKQKLSTDTSLALVKNNIWFKAFIFQVVLSNNASI